MEKSIKDLKKETIILKQKTKESKNRVAFFKFLCWVLDRKKIKEARKKIYE